MKKISNEERFDTLINHLATCYKDVKITTHKFFIENGIRVKKRVMSLFNTGLTLFHLAFNSSRYIRLPFSFTLYDI